MPIEIKEIQAGYLHSPYFKYLYLYLLQNKLPHSKPAIKKKETAALAIPEECVDKIITLYHKSLFAGHQGVIKTYLTISDKFFVPNLIHYLRSYIKGVTHVNYPEMKNHLLDIFRLELMQTMYQCQD